jgi:CrcB protein
MRLLLVMAGGSLGSAARYLAGNLAVHQFGTAFPWGTLTINILGSFLIGLTATAADEAGVIGPYARVFLVVGVLGGFTTFSAFSLESWRLFEESADFRALAYIAASGAIAILAAATGVAVARVSI